MTDYIKKGIKTGRIITSVIAVFFLIIFILIITTI